MRKVTKLENENLDTMGKRITYLRTNLGLSQEELAQQLEIKRQKLSYIESDAPDRQLNIKELTKLADIFNVSTDYILGRVTAMSSDNIDVSKTLNITDYVISAIQQFNENNNIDIINDFLENSFELDFWNTLQKYNKNYTAIKILQNSKIISKINSLEFNVLIDSIYNEIKYTKEDLMGLENYYIEIAQTLIKLIKIYSNDESFIKAPKFVSDLQEALVFIYRIYTHSFNKGKMNHEKIKKYVNKEFKQFSPFPIGDTIKMNLKRHLRIVNEALEKNLIIEEYYLTDKLKIIIQSKQIINANSNTDEHFNFETEFIALRDSIAEILINKASKLKYELRSLNLTKEN